MEYTVGKLGTTVKVLQQSGEFTLLQRHISEQGNPLRLSDPTPFIIAWKFQAHKDGTCDWAQGFYCSSLASAQEMLRLKETIKVNDTADRQQEQEQESEMDIEMDDDEMER